MKIALHNPYFGRPVAEMELVRRFILASSHLGWQAREVATSYDIDQFNPDLVLSLNFRAPKLTKYPTYGCFWDPPEFFESDPQFIKNILSYDGYLSASPRLDQWLKDTYYHLPKPIEILRFYPSCNDTPYGAPSLTNPRLTYVGSNWDGARFQEIFLVLEETGCLDAYGDPKGWNYLKTAYCGSLPFDGKSLLNVLRDSGVGLCLHRDEHYKADVPSMRIFEIVASGAIAICAEHPFIRENFGDRVLYLKPNQTVSETARQINEHLHWIQANPVAAREMSYEAHAHFSKNFTLEKLLKDLLPYHQALLQKQQFISNPHIIQKPEQSVPPSVQVIVRVGHRNLSTIQRALDSLAQQTYPNVEVIIVQYRDLEGLDQLLTTYRNRFQIQRVYSNQVLCRSTQLWAGLNALSSKYFGILDDDDTLHPNHIASLIKLLEEFDNYRVAYSGAIRVWEADKSFGEESHLSSEANPEPASLYHFAQFNLFDFLQLRNTIPSNSFLAETSLLDRRIKQDPQLNLFEVFFLLLNLSQRTKLIFSYQVTSAFHRQISEKGNSIFESSEKHNETMQRIERIMQNQDFSLWETLGYAKAESSDLKSLKNQAQVLECQLREMENKLKEIEDRIIPVLESSLNRVAAMETSKFWQMRKSWFKLKKALGLPSNE